MNTLFLLSCGTVNAIVRKIDIKAVRYILEMNARLLKNFDKTPYEKIGNTVTPLIIPFMYF